jgi:hypothetical protein
MTALLLAAACSINQDQLDAFVAGVAAAHSISTFLLPR